jgi:hypothetical protein
LLGDEQRVFALGLGSIAPQPADDVGAGIAMIPPKADIVSFIALLFRRAAVRADPGQPIVRAPLLLRDLGFEVEPALLTKDTPKVDVGAPALWLQLDPEPGDRGRGGEPLVGLDQIGVEPPERATRLPVQSTGRLLP